MIGATLSLLSILFFVWFGSVLRDRLAAAEGRAASGLPLAAFGGAVVAAAVGLGAETINMAGALSAEDGQLTADTAQAYFDISCALGAPAAGVALAMVALPIGVIALRTGKPVGRLRGLVICGDRRGAADARHAHALVRPAGRPRPAAARRAQHPPLPRPA